MNGLSLSSALIMGVTLHRNDPWRITPRCQAQVAYALIAVVALVESAVAALFIGGAFFIYGSDSYEKNFCIRWLESSAFCIAWSVADFILNPFLPTLVANEGSARQMFRNRDFVNIPEGAWLQLPRGLHLVEGQRVIAEGELLVERQPD